MAASLTSRISGLLLDPRLLAAVGVLAISFAAGLAVPYALAVGASPDDTARLQKLIGAQTAETGNAAGAAFLRSERLVWELEGLCLSGTQRTFACDEATSTLGRPETYAGRANGESLARDFLRRQRPQPLRKRAEKLVELLDAETTALLAKESDRCRVAPGDLFLDYLTYEAIFDLGGMRVLHRDPTAVSATARPLVEGLFAGLRVFPSANRGVSVFGSDDGMVQLNLFGARIEERVLSQESRADAGGKQFTALRWSSNYQSLRGMLDGGPLETEFDESVECAEDGFRVNYKKELEAYLGGGFFANWASLLYCLGAEACADAVVGECRQRPPDQPQTAPAARSPASVTAYDAIIMGWLRRMTNIAQLEIEGWHTINQAYRPSVHYPGMRETLRLAATMYEREGSALDRVTPPAQRRERHAHLRKYSEHIVKSARLAAEAMRGETLDSELMRQSVRETEAARDCLVQARQSN